VEDRLLNDDDMRMFKLMHRAIRMDLGRAPGVVASWAPGDRTRAAAVQRWLEFVERSIHHHHHGEDTWLYPLLESRAPSFTAVRKRLETEHATLDPALHAAREAVEAMVHPGGDVAARTIAVGRLESLRDHMRDHLDVEEAAVIPLMRAHVRKSEVEAFERESSAAIGMADLAMTLPWILSAADATDRATADRVLGWPVRVMNRFWWKPAYDRLLATVLDERKMVAA
jgi:hemerythrin-like domain-containing protein